MPKIDTQVFKALGEMIRPPAAPKAHKDVSWAPDLNPTQQELFDCDAPYILAWSEKFSGKCRTGDAMIYTYDGLRRLRQMKPVGALVGSNPISEMVVAFDGKKCVSARADNFWVEGGRSAMKCTLASGSEFTGSPRHPVWVCASPPTGRHEFRYASLEEMAEKRILGWRFWTPFVGHPSWIGKTNRTVRVSVREDACKVCGKPSVARGLCASHYENLVNHHKQQHALRGSKEIEITEDIAYLLGALTRDGSLNFSSGDNRSAGFSNMDVECLDRVKKAAASLGCHLVRRHPKKHDYGILPAKNIKPLIRALGLDVLSYHKHIPDVIIESPRNVAAAFLRGLFDTDGTVDKNKMVGITTVSNRLARDTQDLLAAFGLLASRRSKKSASGNPTWNVSMCGRHGAAFGREIGFEISRKQARLTNPRISATRPEGHSTGRYGFPEPIRNVMRQAWKAAKIPKTRTECDRLKRFCSFKSTPSRFKVNEAISEFGSADLFGDFFVSDHWLEVEGVEPCEAELFDLSVPGPASFLASGTINHNTIGCLHKVMKHVYENRNAFGILLTRTGNMSKDGGAYHKLVTDVLPQWEAGLGLKTKFGVDKQHNDFVWIQNQFDEWSMIMNTSAPNPEQLEDRFKGREPSIVFVDELTSCSTKAYFTAIAAQLNRRPGVDGVQQYIAATNPDDPEHWVYRTWFEDAFNQETGEWSKSYVNFYFPKQENVKRVGEGYFTGLGEIYKGDSAGAQWMIEGHWVPRASGDGLFRSIYDPIIHVRPLTEDGKADPRRLLNPDKGSPMIIGIDPGSVYNAFVFQQYLKINGKMKWLIFDEVISIKKRISYDAFIPIVMKRIRWWRDKVGAEIPMVWISDNSAFNQYRAAQGSFDVLEIERIYEANRARFRLESIKIKQCPKAPGSVVARTRLGQKMLAEEEVIVSSWCVKVQKMFLMLEGKKHKPGEALDPEALLTPQRSDFIHTWDAVSYPWLMNALIPTALLPSRGGEQTLICSAA